MKVKVDFLWYGLKGRYGIWMDGLWAAMRILGKEFDVEYKEPTDEVRPDAIVLLWEAPITAQHPENGIWYRKVCELPNKKILLFAGGEIRSEWIEDFDHVCVESRINASELEMLEIPHSTAFGINTGIWHPGFTVYEQRWSGIHHGTCASWKRQWLVGEALGDKGLIIGRNQESDPYPFERCRELGTKVMDEMEPMHLMRYMNSCDTCVQTSDYWGGGQRCTLEAMACGIPVICMTDSPKNREYVEESGFGLVVEPNAQAIKEAVEYIQTHPEEFPKEKGIDYVKSKWSEEHYAKNLKEAINNLC
jgi:glycosyltransferase involved in cell wall biosynthesis